MFGLDDHSDTVRREVLVEPAGDLGGQPLLDLRAGGELGNHASELGQSEDAIAGQVADVGDADERRAPYLLATILLDVVLDEPATGRAVLARARSAGSRSAPTSAAGWARAG